MGAGSGSADFGRGPRISCSSGACGGISVGITVAHRSSRVSGRAALSGADPGGSANSFRRWVRIFPGHLRVFECARTHGTQIRQIYRETVHLRGPLSNREGLKEPALVRLIGTLSNTPRPLERLIAKLGEQPAGAQRTKLVHKVTSAKRERRSYKPNRKLSPEEIQNLVAQYEAGSSIADLARLFGMHTQTVDAHLKRQGVEKHWAFRLSSEQVDKAVELYANGWSTIEIAKEFNITTNTANRSLIRAGVTLRSAREGRWYTKRKTTRLKKRNS